jgi:hypothetical protein
MNYEMSFHLIIRGELIRFNETLEDIELALIIQEFNVLRAVYNLVPVQQAAIQLVMTDWSTAQAWVFQLQSKSMAQDEYPFSTKEFQTVKPLGEFLNALLELCGDCHNFLATHSSSRLCSYRNGKEWWRIICAELSGGAMQSAVYGTDRAIGVFKPLSEKGKYGAAIAKELRELKSFKNPYDPTYLPHLSNLINIAITILTRQLHDNNKMKSARSAFLKNTWEPFLSSYQAVREAVCESNSNITITKLEKGKLVRIITGKRKQTIYPAPTQKFLKQSRKSKR